MNENIVGLISVVFVIVVALIGFGYLDVGKIMARFPKKKKKAVIAHDIYGGPPLDVHEPVVGFTGAFGYDERFNAIEKRLKALEDQEHIVISTTQSSNETAALRQLADMLARELNRR